MTNSVEDQARSAVIYIAEDENGRSRRSLSCTVRELGPRRLVIQAHDGIRACSPVSVEYNDTLFLGEVSFSSRVAGGWMVEIVVEQTLTDLQGLLVLRARLLGEPVPQDAGTAAVSRNR